MLGRGNSLYAIRDSSVIRRFFWRNDKGKLVGRRVSGFGWFGRLWVLSLKMTANQPPHAEGLPVLSEGGELPCFCKIRSFEELGFS